jgi:hypothetical protein
MLLGCVEESVIKRIEIIIEFFLRGIAELSCIEPERLAVSFN